MSGRITIEERIIGMWAVERGWMSEKQLCRALSVVDFYGKSSLVQALLDEGYLNQSQIDMLCEQYRKDHQELSKADSQK